MATATLEPAYSTEDLRLLEADSGEFTAVSPDGFQAIEAVPEFAARWADTSSLVHDNRDVLTATVNSSGACPIGAKSLCGQYCFAHRSWSASTSPRKDTAEKYTADAKKLAANGKEVGIFMSYDTEPFPGGEICRISRELLRHMIEHPPRALLVHSHTANIGLEPVVELLAELSKKTNVIAGIGFETDTDNTAGNRPHHHCVQERFDALARLSAAGVKTQASTTPLLGFTDYPTFIKRFHDAGTHRIMIGELRKEFVGGGATRANGLDIGLEPLSEDEAREICECHDFPGGVDIRETFYVTMS